MRNQNTKIDFSNQTIVVGIDVHKKQWKVSLRTEQMELRTFSMNPSAEELVNYLKKNYPGGNYKSVYEAGFSGFGADRLLRQMGMNNIVVNPGDVPTKNKERGYRTDKIDARKLARELESGTISGIYVPNEMQEELRSLSRLRQQLVKDQSRIKQRIKGLLMYYGKHIPDRAEMEHWSGRFIKHLETIEFNTEAGRQCLETYLIDLREKRAKISQVLKKLRNNVKGSEHEAIVKILCTVPGVAFITAITIYTEIMDINRFSSMDQLCSYIGVVPSVDSSGEHERVIGITHRQNKYLRNILIEAAWVAVKKDPALTEKFVQLKKRMTAQRAIIRITKKLVSRIRSVWLNNKPYEFSKKK